DGLLGHDTGLRIKEHYTDTASFTDQVFGMSIGPRRRLPTCAQVAKPAPKQVIQPDSPIRLSTHYRERRNASNSRACSIGSCRNLSVTRSASAECRLIESSIVAALPS
ncbi:MAG: Tn3 family transposase, partial [Planctomycetes bacterium]|nr:Tn3 family transposase [Planctomycetota bacterium]